MPQTDLIIWLVVYLVLTLLIYITYGIVLSMYDYPGKDEKWDVVLMLIIASAATLIMSGVAIAVFGSAIPAAALLFVSIMLDYIVGGMVGTVEVMADGSTETSGSLSYATYSPMAYKTILFGYLAYLAGSYHGDSAFGSGQLKSRPSGTSTTKQFAKQRFGMSYL